MKYAMLSNLIPQELEEKFRKNTYNTMQDASNALQWNIYNGLCKNLNNNIPLFNILPVDSFPQYYKYPFIFSKNFGTKGINLGFCNVKLIRNYFQTSKIYKTLLKWCSADSEQKVLFVYTMAQPFVMAISRIKKKFPELKVCTIVADLPNMSSLSSHKSVLKSFFIKKRSQSAFALSSNIDCFVLLTKHMAEYMKISQPFCVMEGIAEVKNDSIKVDYNQAIKTILYTGTLHKKFGILHLLEAFKKISDDNYRLVICGVGDGEPEIKQSMFEDNRIEFKGQLTRDDILELQKTATVLVNPRLGNEEFTKYSFPSKTMEYLASGVPVVAYKLEGFPDDYDEYIYYPSDDTPEKLAEVLKNVCEISSDEREQRGMNARRFVLEHKNKYVQTKKIIELVESIM